MIKKAVDCIGKVRLESEARLTRPSSPVLNEFVIGSIADSRESSRLKQSRDDHKAHSLGRTLWITDNYNANMTISEAIERFLEGYFSTCRRSPKTRTAYKLDLRQLEDFIGQAELKSVTAEKMEEWALKLGGDLEPAT